MSRGLSFTAFVVGPIPVKMDGAIPPTHPAGQRTLAAILFTDVVGFSALMQQQEERTLQLLERDFAEMRRLCAEHEGAVLKTTGDGLLCTFASAVKAVACAVAMQRGFGRTAQSPDALQHRIGIHLGDVLVQQQDVMGDGVNIASRLQAEAEPGGICISQTVYDVVKNKLAIQTTYIGPRELKNIADAVPAYRVLIDAESGGGSAPASRGPNQTSKPGRARRWIGVGCAVAAAAAIGFVVWHLRPSAAAPADTKSATVARTPAPASVAAVAAPTPAAVAVAPASTTPMAQPVAGNTEDAELAGLPSDPKKLMAVANQRFLRHYEFDEFERALDREDPTVGGKRLENAKRMATHLISLREWMQQRLTGYDAERPLRVPVGIGTPHPGKFSVFGVSHDEIGVIRNGAVVHEPIRNLPPMQFGELALTLLEREEQPPPDLMQGAAVFVRVFHLTALQDQLEALRVRSRNAQTQNLKNAKPEPNRRANVNAS